MAPDALKAELVILRGQHGGLSIPLGDSALLVGRDPDCDLQLFDEGVAGHHFRLCSTEEDYLVEPLGAGGAIWLNDVPVRRASPLYHTDLIRAGETTLQFLCPEAQHPGRSAVDLFASEIETSPVSLEAFLVETPPAEDALPALGELLREIARQETAPQVIETLIEGLARLLPYRRIVYVRHDPRDGRLVATRHRRAPEDQPGGRWKVHRALIERCCTHGAPLSHTPSGGDASLVAPLEGREGVLGALYLELAPGEDPQRSLRLLAAVCGQAGLVLERCCLLSLMHHTSSVERSKLRALLDSLPDGVALLDEEGRSLVANPQGEAYLAQLGLRAASGAVERIDGRPLDELAGAPLQLECGERSFLVRLTRTTAGWRGYGLAIRDVTEEQQARLRLIQAEKLSSLGQTVSGVAHELNNPLTGVLGFAEMLIATPGIDPAISRQLEIIHCEAERCRRIVKNLLAFARRQGPELSLVEIDALLDEVLELKGYELQVNDARVVRRRAPELPRTCADGHQLKQVLLNLVHNASQAVAGRAGAEIVIATRQAGETIEVEVADNGPGIPLEHRGRIFDPFFTTKEVGAGVGLGLSLSYGIVSEHGGRIRVESAPGAGARFVVSLPIRRELPPGQQVAPVRRTASGRLVAPRLVLVVDDEPVVRELIGLALDKLGCGYEIARSGREALRLATERRYDGMICDLRMPGMSGEELHAALRRRGNSITGRTLFVSGDVAGEGSHGFLAQSGCPYVLKPFSLAQLQGALLELPGFNVSD